MRELKFRVWNKKEKQFVDDCLIGLDGLMWWESGYDHGYYYDPVEVMQYTGLKDKNDREIYEGDILCGQFTAFIRGMWEVYFDESLGAFKKLTIRPIPDHLESKYPLDLLVGKAKVIGNIYENPELLEKK